jgi:nickel transport protein
MNSGFRYVFVCLLFIICCLLTVSPVYAHKVSIYAYTENGMVHSESYFVDGSKCKNSVVEVFDGKDGTKLLEGKTDENGKFSFKIPKTTSLKLVLHASMGHQADYTLSEDEVREAIDKQHPVQPPANKVPTRSKDISTAKKETTETRVLKTISESEIEAIVERAVDKKTEPLLRMLVKLQERSEKPGITEIIGGIGYIIGLMGIAMFFKNRRVSK